MNLATRQSLNALNCRFYGERASEFDATRKHEWPGWQRTIDLFHATSDTKPTPVLDIGCGNGRFAHFVLNNHPIGAIDYTGVDQSPELLAIAENECIGSKADSLRWLKVDVASEELERAPLSDSYQLVVAFGLLHHIPSLDSRKKLISFLARRLSAGGTLAFTVWRFDQAERFRSKLIPWQEYNQHAVEKIDTDELEPGDYLMSFGDTSGTPRYCHAPDEAEIRALTDSLGLECVAQFAADGKTGDLNEYHVFVKSDGDSH